MSIRRITITVDAEVTPDWDAKDASLDSLGRVELAAALNLGEQGLVTMITVEDQEPKSAQSHRYPSML